MIKFKKNALLSVSPFIILLIIVINKSSFAQDDGQEMKNPVTVKEVDLKRYAGTWYEIARIPNRFQNQCVKNVTATYKLRDDGVIDVINRCVEEDGCIDEAEGIAKVVDESTFAKLEVSFVSFLGIRPFWGDYWILGLEENYKYAIVGDPSRKYGWILSRTQQMTDEDLERCYKILRKQGYNPDNFIKTEQE